MQGHRVVLRQHIDRAQARVEAVADWNIDQPIFAAQRYSWLRTVFCQWKQTRPGAAAHDNGERVLHCAWRQRIRRHVLKSLEHNRVAASARRLENARLRSLTGSLRGLFNHRTLGLDVRNCRLCRSL